MNFDVYFPFQKDGKWIPGVKPVKKEWDAIKREVLSSDTVKTLIAKHRAGEEGCKIQLPAIGFVGDCQKTRASRYMIPTQLVMIDIDHMDDARQSWTNIKETIIKELGNDFFIHHIQLVHLTPSEGLHIFFSAIDGFNTLKENMDFLDSHCKFEQYGDYDSVVHDFARISFAFRVDEILFENAQLIMNTTDWGHNLVNEAIEENKDTQETEKKVKSATTSTNPVPVITPEQAEKMEKEEYKGTLIKTIIDRFVEVNGAPGKNEVHNYYNMMIKYFRNITSNNKVLLFHLLPKFGHTDEECWSQICSICRVNTLSSLDKPFYWFLRDNGFILPREGASEKQMKEYMLSDYNPASEIDGMPTLPPVFREFVNSAPKDFKVCVINALLPIIGTLTSWVKAIYPYDDAYHTTSFFSVIYAPPGTGKSFVNRLLERLFCMIELRDTVQNARQNIYLNTLLRKGGNDKAPESPHTSQRIFPPKNSETEFLSKQRDNHGYHMFTFAAEMDSWAKGEKAAGGNKSDMIRIAWDNGKYGQAFKSANTFNGQVSLYWNVLITGTLQQVESYFKNVENGLVTRCSFTALENQEFQLANRWKPISKKGGEIISRFVKKCDDMTYESPCTVSLSELEAVNDEDFDKEIDWRFKFKERQIIDMSWIMPVIDAFHVEQVKIGVLDVDKARDVFRRRVGVRGFRLAMICWCLYNNPRKRELEVIKNFVAWWMREDLKCMLKLWGQKYNEQAEVAPKLYNRNVFSKLDRTFTKGDVYTVVKREGIKSPVKQIVYNWIKQGYVNKIGKDSYEKRR